MAFKTVNYGEKTKQKHEFVGRNKEKSIFWDNFRYLKEHLNEDESKILSYYGFTSGGKTSLCKQIIKEISEKNSKVSETEQMKYLYYDFKQSQEYTFVLEAMCEDLKERYNFFFAMFDYAWYVYNVKNGSNPNSKEMKYLVNNSKILTYMVKSIGTVPVDNATSMFTRYAEKGNAVIRKFVTKHKDEIKKIEKSRNATLETMLVNYFAKDLRNNLVGTKEPFVVFFDSYEQMVGELTDKSEPLENDLWLRNLQDGEEGLLILIPNTLWVISSRESLKWKNYSKMWDESAVEQHEVENLCKEDTVAYLNTNDIFENDLCEELFELTKGKIVDLDSCVERYEELTDMFEDPSIDKFTNNWGAIARDMLKYIDEETKDILYLMADIGKWTDESFSTIASEKNIFIDESKYIKVLNSSYVEKEYKRGKNSVKSYRLREDVGFILSNGCNFRDDQDEKATKQKKRKKVKNESPLGMDKRRYGEEENLDDSIMNEELLENSFDSNTFEDVKDNFSISMHDEVDGIWCQKYTEMKDELYMYIRTYRFEEFDSMFFDMWDNIKNNEVSKEYVLFASIYLLYLTKKSDYRNVDKFLKQIKEIYRSVNLSEEEVLNVESALARGYYFVEDYEMAYKLDKNALEVRKNMLGNEDNDTLLSLEAVGIDCLKLEKIDEAYSCIDEVYNTRNSLYGSDDMDTLRCLRYFANACGAMGENEKAFDISRDLYERSKNIAGRDHPDTILALKNIGLIYSELQMYQEALNIARKVCEKFEKTLGIQNIKTIEGLKELANICIELNLNDEATKAKKKTYEGYKKSYGKNNYSTLRAKFELAKMYKNIKKYEKALILSEEAYDEYKNAYGEEHSETIECLKVFGESYDKLDMTDTDDNKMYLYEQYRILLGGNIVKDDMDIEISKNDGMGLNTTLNSNRGLDDRHSNINKTFSQNSMSKQTIENAPMPRLGQNFNARQSPINRSLGNNQPGIANRRLGSGFGQRNFNSPKGAPVNRTRSEFGQKSDNGGYEFSDSPRTKIAGDVRKSQNRGNNVMGNTRRRKVSFSRSEGGNLSENSDDEFAKLFEEVDKAVQDETNKANDEMENFKVSLEDVGFGEDSFDQFVQFDSGIEIDNDYFNNQGNGYSKADDWN